MNALSGLKKTFDHGVRARYVQGCRCQPCTIANRTYARENARAAARGDGNPLVPADIARKHLRRLSRQGVGYKTAADAACVATSVVAKIVSGERTQIRRKTAQRLLAVTRMAAGEATLVPAGRTWKEGFTKARIAQAIGNKMPALQINPERVTLKTVGRIERLVRRYSA
jgi:hypothetical protein